MVTRFLRPRDAAEAVAMLHRELGSVPISGGSYLLSSEFVDCPMTVVSVSGLLPADMVCSGNVVVLGANATFQDIVDWDAAPSALRDAARSMTNRHIRNRATVAGNVGANKSCASLAPLFLASDAVFELADGAGTVSAQEWLSRPRGSARGLIARITLALGRDRHVAYRRYSRTSSDVSVLTAAVSYGLDGGALRGVRVALGGLGPHTRRFPEIEALLEGQPLTDRDAIEAATAPLLCPIDDMRGSAGFKRLRASALLADALIHAEARQ
jgi:probable selenate reductase FAD-binding subunit